MTERVTEGAFPVVIGQGDLERMPPFFHVVVPNQPGPFSLPGGFDACSGFGRSVSCAGVEVRRSPEDSLR
jgi:hypothetical protein